jgi:exonuclease SbcC
MLKKLILKNFKTHEISELEFSPGINVITGDSGNGKTNILKALNWVVNNRPRGDSVIRRGQKDCSVALTTIIDNKEYTIERARGKSENSYKILDKEGKELGSFTSFGSSPPEDVSKLIGLSDINVQPQLKPYFLVLDSPGQVATYIRSLIKLDVIDQVVKCLSGKVRDEKAELSSLEMDLQEVEAGLKELDKVDLEGLERRILEAKSIVEAVRVLEKRKEGLERIAIELENLEAEWISLPDDVNQTLERANELCCTFIELSEKISKLRSLSEELKRLEKDRIVLPEDLTILFTIEESEKKYNDIYAKVNVLLGIREGLLSIDTEMMMMDDQLSGLEKEKQLLMEQLGSCPYCGSELTIESKKCLLGGGGKDGYRRNSSWK